MKPVTGDTLIGPDALQWRPSNLMKIPNAYFLERTGGENLGARLWRMPPHSSNRSGAEPSDRSTGDSGCE